MNTQLCAVYLISCLILPQVVPAVGYKLLVVPFSAGFNSRFLNIVKLAEVLGQDNHEVYLLISSITRHHVSTKVMEHVKIIEFSVPQNLMTVNNVSLGDKKPSSNPFDRMDQLLSIEKEFCRCLISNDDLIYTLEEANYDLFLGDLYSPCATSLASYLNLTTVWYLNMVEPGMSDFFYPNFPSFTCLVPGAGCTSDHMTFMDRVKNFALKMVLNYIIWDRYCAAFTSLLQEYNKLKTSITEFAKNKVVIANMDFILDSPLPLLPHIKPIGGLFIKKPSALPENLENIMSSSPHGVILLSFGVYVPEFDDRKAEILAKVFGRLPQTILWRNSGQKPKSLQPNTHIIDWLPQNDLLARSEVKLFITHGGISSVFEAAYYGKPIIALPLTNEQIFQAMKITNKVKGGILLDYYSLNEEDLLTAIQEVLHNPIYSENIEKTSELLRNKVVTPQRQFQHIVNYTIQSKGAPHLFHPYAGDMNTIQFYAIDVILFIVLIIVLVLVIIVLSLMLVIRCLKMCCQKAKPKTE